MRNEECGMRDAEGREPKTPDRKRAPRDLSAEDLARMIDHTELSAHSGRGKIQNLCDEAKTFGFIAVCVNPVYVAFAADLLRGSGVRTCAVAGFPLGASRSEVKAFEAKRAVEDGAAEIDMVVAVGALREARYDEVRDDIRAVVEASRPAIVKVILETCFLTDEEIVKGCRLAVEGGARFVKTSTGFGDFGAFPAHVRLMRDTVGPDIGVKAAGGIKNFKDAWRVIEAGADRIGTSASVAIMEGFSLLRFAPGAWLEPEIPCHLCPSRYATLAKQSKATYAYYKRKCQACEYCSLYNKFYD